MPGRHSSLPLAIGAALAGLALVCACNREPTTTVPPDGSEASAPLPDAPPTDQSAPPEPVDAGPSPLPAEDDIGTALPDEGEPGAGDMAAIPEGAPAMMSEDEFLDAYRALEGVSVTESGLMYRVLASGSGRAPTAADRVRVNYRGTLMDGTVFDETPTGAPAEFAVGELIAGWREALLLMHEGDRWELVIPSHLAYGEEGALGVVPPNSPLVFELELLAVL